MKKLCEASTGVDYSHLQPKIQICGKEADRILRRLDYPWEIYVCIKCCIKMTVSGKYDIVANLREEDETG